MAALRARYEEFSLCMVSFILLFLFFQVEGETKGQWDYVRPRFPFQSSNFARPYCILWLTTTAGGFVPVDNCLPDLAYFYNGTWKHAPDIPKLRNSVSFTESKATQTNSIVILRLSA